MSNVVEVRGAPRQVRKIKDMAKGEAGYTVPWAYEGGVLDEAFPIYPRAAGTATLFVKCKGPGKYALTFKD